MADPAPEFKPDILAALKLLIAGVAAQMATTAQGIHRSIHLAAQMLEPPAPPPDPDPTNQPLDIADTPDPGADKKK